MNKNPNQAVRYVIIGSGIALIVLSVVILGMSAWEGVGGFGKKFQVVQLPGFHELELTEPGLYGGVYQHRAPGPIPVQQLSKMDVRILFKKTYDAVPVLMNTTGQTFNKMGVKGMPVFNFAIQEPGIYSLSGIYMEGNEGPTVPIMVFPQAAQNIKQTLIVGGLFFALFLALGIILLAKVNVWAPKNPHS